MLDVCATAVGSLPRTPAATAAAPAFPIKLRRPGEESLAGPCLADSLAAGTFGGSCFIMFSKLLCEGGKQRNEPCISQPTMDNCSHLPDDHVRLNGLGSRDFGCSKLLSLEKNARDGRSGMLQRSAYMRKIIAMLIAISCHDINIYT